MIGLLFDNGNLLQNSGFENGLDGWATNNVALGAATAAEGTISARMEKGEASLSQDVLLDPVPPKPLLLSFIAFMEDDEAYSARLIVEVLWLDAMRRVIGTGLKAFLGPNIIANARVTFFDCTDKPPSDAYWARLLLSKGNTASSRVSLDAFNLVPLESPNLMRNPSFESGMDHWAAENFSIDYAYPWEGNSSAVCMGAPATLRQDVPLGLLRTGSAFLLSFAAQSSLNANMDVQLIWLNAAGLEVGSPGIDLPINALVLSQQANYVSFLALSGPAPLGAVAARIQFSVGTIAESSFRIDHVMLMRTASGNLVRNPGFAGDMDHWAAEGVAEAQSAAYVGNFYARFERAGGSLYQTVKLPPVCVMRFFLFSFALLHSDTTVGCGDIQARVIWLDASENELGDGAGILALPFSGSQAQWLVYAAATSRAPLGAAAARLQFTKASGFTSAPVGIDHVLFARMD